MRSAGAASSSLVPGRATWRHTLSHAHPESGGAEERHWTDIAMRMGAVQARGEVLSPDEPDGFRMAVKSDAFV